jgi:mannose-6-phosphate isomerase-like protein (cupin superfamily)
MILNNDARPIINFLLWVPSREPNSFVGIFEVFGGLNPSGFERPDMGYDTARKTDAESVVPEEFGGMWFLKDELSTDSLGITVLELEPGGKGKEHDHGEVGQEEIYYVVSGTIDVHLGGETVSVGPEEAIRIDSDQRRQIENNGDERAMLVLAGAPLDR